MGALGQAPDQRRIMANPRCRARDSVLGREPQTRRLDAPSAPIVFTHRANMVGHLSSETPDEVAMMIGLDLPSGGCWGIAADFKGEHLNYVISPR